jgi:hypothetical protein
LLYSALDGGLYTFCLKKATLETAPTESVCGRFVFIDVRVCVQMLHGVAANIGTLTNIVVSDLFIHDVNGTQRIKNNGGIIFTTRGERIPSRFDGLRIERNIIWRVDRSGIVAQSYHARRNRWFPSRNVVIRDNWLGDLGGDGITP